MIFAVYWILSVMQFSCCSALSSLVRGFFRAFSFGLAASIHGRNFRFHHCFLYFFFKGNQMFVQSPIFNSHSIGTLESTLNRLHPVMEAPSPHMQCSLSQRVITSSHQVTYSSLLVRSRLPSGCNSCASCENALTLLAVSLLVVVTGGSINCYLDCNPCVA